MRSTILAAAAMAAGALAVPLEKRVLVTDYEIVYVTEYVTVTAGQPLPSQAAASSTQASSSSVSSSAPQYTFHRPSPSSSAASIASSSAAAASSSSAAAASTSTSTSHTSSSALTTWTTILPPGQSTVLTTSTTPATSAASTPSTSVASSPSTTSTSTQASSTPATSATSASGSTPTSYEEIVVYHHNIHRANHSASDIAWSDNLASIAASIAATCVYEHNTTAGGGGYGQNIAAGVESNNVSAIITDLFYNAEVGYFAGLYGEAQPDMTNFEHWGHFSQIVWKATSMVGCATQYCPNGLANTGTGVAPYFTVCNYESPGNYANEYGDNIGEPLGEPTAQWNTGL